MKGGRMMGCPVGDDGRATWRVLMLLVSVRCVDYVKKRNFIDEERGDGLGASNRHECRRAGAPARPDRTGGFSAKAVFNQHGVIFFPVDRQHRDQKAPGISYADQSAGNALAVMLSPGMIEI
jgi:hypothetical protein